MMKQAVRKLSTGAAGRRVVIVDGVRLKKKNLLISGFYIMMIVLKVDFCLRGCGAADNYVDIWILWCCCCVVLVLKDPFMNSNLII
jgi:hypothetical protein